MRLPCVECGEDRERKEFGAGRWRHRETTPLVCLACKPIRLSSEELELEFAFVRDIIGLDHQKALDWLAAHCDRTVDYLERAFGSADNPKPYRPYEFAEIRKVVRSVITYTALDGQLTQGTIWCEGPKDKTLWVIRQDGSCAVVIPGEPGKEVEYAHPERPECIYPREIIDTAREVLEGYATAQKDLAGLGYVQPIGQDYAVAAAIVSAYNRSQKARQPYLDTRPHAKAVAQPVEKTAKGEFKMTSDTTRLPVSLKRIRELTQKDIEQ